MLHSVLSKEEEGLECLNRVLLTQPVIFFIMYQTNGQAGLINALR